jgi:hypothetical protein
MAGRLLRTSRTEQVGHAEEVLSWICVGVHAYVRVCARMHASPVRYSTLPVSLAPWLGTDRLRYGVLGISTVTLASATTHL